MSDKSDWILYVCTFPPRECGIATFTKDLTTAMDKKYHHSIKSKIVAMNNDSTNIYNYPEEVILEINEDDIQEYIDAAKKVNDMERIKLVNVQHEFGIFGGEYGCYLVAFLEIITKPIILTFHSVLPEPNDKLKKIVQDLAGKSVSIVVMNITAKDILERDYAIKTPIEVIPHGIPTVQFCSSKKEKIKIGYPNKIVLSSFGMMNRGKGYEYVIEALPKIVEKFPSVVYLIVGETHPVVRKKEGEQYRNLLEKRVKELGLQKHVKFYNKYVKLSEIVSYLLASDIHICSNLEPNQVTSGTLAYAMGVGRVVISTPFLHAKDAVNSERGILVEFRNPDSIAEAVIRVLSDTNLKEQMEKNSYSYTRRMTWSNVALYYMNMFNKHVKFSDTGETPLPKVNLNHLIKLTDDLGIIQFANNSLADVTSGYTIDDNARAMIVCCMYHQLFKNDFVLKPIRTYMRFIKYAQQKDGRIFNFVDHTRKVEMCDWSEDAHGRAVWALGFLISSDSLTKEIRDGGEAIFKKAIQIMQNIRSPRAVAFLIAGLYFYNKSAHSKEIIREVKNLADHLVSLYKDNSTGEWQWFESYLTYSNAKLPEALLFTYLMTQEEHYLKIALSSLDFLISLTFDKRGFAPIGQKGWYFKGGFKAHFDQQPVDTASMVQALMLAYEVTKDEKYKKFALVAFQWFSGRNSLNQVVYDETTGGCHDGLGEWAVNLNQGTESTLSYLIARLAFYQR